MVLFSIAMESGVSGFLCIRDYRVVLECFVHLSLLMVRVQMSWVGG